MVLSEGGAEQARLYLTQATSQGIGFIQPEHQNVAAMVLLVKLRVPSKSEMVALCIIQWPLRSTVLTILLPTPVAERRQPIQRVELAGSHDSDGTREETSEFDP